MYTSDRRLFVIAVLLTFWCFASFVSFEGRASADQATEPSEDSSSALQSQLNLIVQAAQKGDNPHFDQSIDELQIPPESNWFASNFGDAGSKLASAYAASWESYKAVIAREFLRDHEKPAEAIVEAFSLEAFPVKSQTGANNGQIRAILQNATKPLTMYGAEIDIKDSYRKSLPGHFVFAEGKFRIVSNQTFYSLPNVKPTRARFPPQLLESRLVDRVPPKLSPEQVSEHGNVVVHIIIGIDGAVTEATPVSGPADLAAAAVDAIRQWHYKPMILGGDPIEVDTTVTVTF